MRKFLPAVAANVSAALSEILLMAAAAWLIASAALHPPLSALSTGITLVRTAGIARAALRYGDRFLSHRIIFKILDDLREKLFRRAAAQLPLKSGKTGEGALLHELTIEADLLKDFLPRVILPLSTAALVILLLTILLSRTIGAAALILPALFVLVLISSMLIKFEDADDSPYREKLLDFHGAAEELKIYGVEPAIKNLNRAAEKFGGAQLQIQRRKINFDTAVKILAALGVCVILLELCATIGKIELIVWALILLTLPEIFATIPAAVRSHKNFSPANEPKPFAQDVSTNLAVDFRAVTFGYDSAQPVLKNFNLQIERGEHWAIIGESGAGKTTLLYLMTKLFAPDGGSVAVNGKIAAMTPANYVFADSIRANFAALHENISDAEILAALKICQLDFDIAAPLGEDGAKLSGGERARLQIALALAKNPDVLILDEPTAGLNESLAEDLIAAIIDDANQKNRTLIIITHDLNIARRLENILELQSSVEIISSSSSSSFLSMHSSTHASTSSGGLSKT